jgi:hypothetical protein
MGDTTPTSTGADSGATATTPPGRLDVLAEDTDTTGWIKVQDDRVGVRLLVPPELFYRIRKLPPLIQEFDPPDVARYELEVADVPVDARTPRPEGTRPTQNVSLRLLFLPAPLQPIPFGATAGTPTDQTTLDVMGAALTVRDLPETELAPRRVVAQANISVPGGTLHLSGIVYPAESDELVTMILGMLQTMEVR